MDLGSTCSPAAVSRTSLAFFAALACSTTSLIISFIGIAEFDLPATRYVRSVTAHLPGDQLTIPWMAFTSHAGNWIGEGWHLVVTSVVILSLGLLVKKHTVTVAAIQTFIAHAIAAVLANGLKHLIGRPRPKFTHSGDWQIGMAWSSGWDSFPSGHSTASFAVATVLAKRFPTMAPLCIGIAVFVALSRVLRGSHFPTDVVGGAVLGILSGSLAMAPLRSWRISIGDGLRHAALGVSVVFTILWALSRPMADGMVGMLLPALATVAILGGVWLRRGYWSATESSREGWQANASGLLILYGLAALTTSPLVLSSMGLACLAVWFMPVGASGKTGCQPSGLVRLRESMMLGGLVAAIVILTEARGVLPFR